MSVEEFLELSTDLSGVVVSVFDCYSETVVYIGELDREPIRDIEEEAEDAGAILCSEVESYDLFKDKDGQIHLELNISLETED